MGKELRKASRKILKIGLVTLLILLGLHVIFRILDLSDIVSAFPGAVQEEKKYATTEHGWNLILVNSEYYIPQDYQIPEFTELSNGEKVDSRIYPALQQMFNDARATGLDLFVASGYRTEERQQELLEERIRMYRLQGDSKSEASEKAHRWVAEPGTSEHQLGIAVDINANTEVSTSEEVYGWLEENAHKYGFIKRYPSNKVHITGIAHEPWHYRYVGVEIAEEIYQEDVCLEEYIEERYDMTEALQPAS